MLRYLDFPPTPAADATRVSAFDRDQPITSVSIVCTHDPSYEEQQDAPYWQIWLGLPQTNRFLILDIACRGICCGQLVATAKTYPPPPLAPPHTLTLTHHGVLVRDVLKLIYDYALDCYAFESAGGRGRRFWIASVLRQFEVCGILVRGSSMGVYKYFERHGERLVSGHFLAPKEFRPSAVVSTYHVRSFASVMLNFESRNTGLGYHVRFMGQAIVRCSIHLTNRWKPKMRMHIRVGSHRSTRDRARKGRHHRYRFRCHVWALCLHLLYPLHLLLFDYELRTLM